MTKPPDWDLYRKQALGQAEARRLRVLQHPVIAARLTREPLNYSRPEQWSGYIPPVAYGAGKDRHASKIRAALIDICTAVLQREQELSDQSIDGPPAEDNQAPPVAPDLITDKQLQKLHACFNDLEITKREDKLDYVALTTGRQVESTKDMTKSEASQVIEALVRIIGQETTSEPESDKQAATHPGDPGVDNEAGPTGLWRGTGTGWGDDGEPPY